MDSRLQEIAENLDKMKIGVDEPFRFHCDQCGKCCINREDILLNPRDVYNMAKELGQEPKDVFALYCEYYIGSDSRFPLVRIKPRGSIKRCPLMKDRKCSIPRRNLPYARYFPSADAFRLSRRKKNSRRKTLPIFLPIPDAAILPRAIRFENGLANLVYRLRTSIFYYGTISL